MDSLFWVLWFQIDRDDLETLLTDIPLAPAQQNEDVAAWEQRIRIYANLQVKLTQDWRVYGLDLGESERRLFFNTNISEAVFVINSH